MPTKKDIIDALASRKHTPMFPSVTHRVTWGKATRHTIVQKVIARAAERVDTPWPQLLESDYLAYKKSGDRRSYEVPYFERRDRLGIAAIAFALTGEERFLREATNGILFICEEPTWCLPVHAASSSVDIFVCQTSQLLAETCSLLSSELLPNLENRAKDLVRNRVINPILAGKTWWWMNGGTSNWGPWCASGIAAAAIWCENDHISLGQILHKMIQIGEQFIAASLDDGGCEEGIHYWIRSTGSLVDLFETIKHETGISLYNDTKLKRMVRFPVTMYLGNRAFPAFSDSEPTAEFPIGLCWRAAERTGCSEFHDLLNEQPIMNLKAVDHTGDALLNLLRLFFWTNSYIPTEPLASILLSAKNNWLPNLQVLVARSSETALAVKGGHNKENHNHNDVGQFVIYHKGMPVLVDAGRDTYTKTAFSNDRFTLWWTRGSGHAVPVIGGHEQQYGSKYAATNVHHSSNETSISFSADIAGCYAASAGIDELERKVVLDRESGTVTITDRIRQRSAQTVVLNLLTAIKPKAVNKLIRIGPMLLEIGNAVVSDAQRIILKESTQLASSWPNGLWRLRLKVTPGIAGEWKLILRPETVKRKI